MTTRGGQYLFFLPGIRGCKGSPKASEGSSPVRPEEDIRFLPRRDGTGRLRCYRAPGISAPARTSENSDVLELNGLTRRYGDLVALDDLSFTVAEGASVRVRRP